ncbi:hypothetical protein MtrunA17_Chr3g0120961 [Medicago truncatula]|uniref:Uncharacterized protein n=1 Tax=Medicago truncatula TaxID=3880 RepID=A0A396IWV3_MEDTR|nr:hypothetical protein MtrunA17_Chr3g0120961 [Medicago truncatula]
MSKGSDTCLFGVIRPAPDSCDERGKRQLKYVWESKRVKDLEISDCFVHDDDIKPLIFKCDRFEYRNKAQIQKDKEIKVAMAEYKQLRRGLSNFDAIAPPRIAGLVGCIVPIPINDDLRLQLTPLWEAALGAKFVLADIVKTTWRPGGMYYITFQAKEQDPPNRRPVTTFQAQFWKRRPEPEVISRAIKT